MCKGDMEEKAVTHSVDIDGCVVVVKGVPARVCTQCGEIWYSGIVTERLEKIIDEIASSSNTEIAVVKYTNTAA
jgi:YgiT-type zinc finger domain-containing protein